MTYKEIIPNPKPEPRDTLYIDEVDFTKPIFILDNKDNFFGFVIFNEDYGLFNIRKINDKLFYHYNGVELNYLVKDIKKSNFKCVTIIKF